MRWENRARFDILLAAVLFSTGGAAIKACTLSAFQVAGFRSGIAAVLILVLVPAARRGWTRRTLLVSVAYAATLVLYVTANKLTTAANTIFLQSTAPLYVLLLSPWLLRERIRWRDLMVMFLLMSGLVLLLAGYQTPLKTAPQPVLGNVLATAAGFSWALTLMGLRWLGRSGAAGRDVTLAAVCSGNLLAFLVSLPFALPVAQSRAADWMIIVFLGLFQIGLAYICLTAGVIHLPALEVSIILLIEPVMNPIWALLLHAEVPNTWAIGGGALIVGATVLKARR